MAPFAVSGPPHREGRLTSERCLRGDIHRIAGGNSVAKESNATAIISTKISIRANSGVCCGCASTPTTSCVGTDWRSVCPVAAPPNVQKNARKATGSVDGTADSQHYYNADPEPENGGSLKSPISNQIPTWPKSSRAYLGYIDPLLGCSRR